MAAKTVLDQATREASEAHSLALAVAAAEHAAAVAALMEAAASELTSAVEAAKAATLTEANDSAAVHLMARMKLPTYNLLPTTTT